MALARVDLLHDWITAQIAAHGGAGVADAGTHADAGAMDAGVADAGAHDAGAAADAGAHDAAMVDAGAHDAAVVNADAGAHDAAVADAGAQDAAVADAGARDAGGSACVAATMPVGTLATAVVLGACASGALTATNHTASRARNPRHRMTSRRGVGRAPPRAASIAVPRGGTIAPTRSSRSPR